jgi:calcineurin-like phosphoesterase family protein
MNAVIVDSINSIVRENDILIHLGDWSFGGIENIELFRNQIICKNIHLLLGNHDHHIEKNKNNVQSLFKSVQHYMRLEIEEHVINKKIKRVKHKFVLMHFPIASWDNMNKGVIHLHGHVHLKKHHCVSKEKAIDIGMDGNDMDVYSLETILEIMKKQPIAKLSLPYDHHENDNDGNSRL